MANTRELSQLASIINVVDSSKSLSISTSTNSFVGIGTDVPTSKLQVIGDAFITGVVTASGGFNLGISSAGTSITSDPITTLNFIGAGNTFAVDGSTVDISIAGGGGGSVSISTEAPTDPSAGDLWYSPTYGRTFIYYQDDDSSQWVDAAPFNDTRDLSLTIGRRNEVKVLSITPAGVNITLRSGIGTASF